MTHATAPTLVLFDIDGTLTTGSHAGRAALEAALDAVLGTTGALRDVVLHGNTDWVIVRDAARAVQRWPDAPAARRALVGDVVARYRDALATRVVAEPYRALPGARASVLAARAACEHAGLATGNVQACALYKLRSAGLLDLFDACVGGYGDEAEDREGVVRKAIARARDRGLAAQTVLVIGDTPADVAAGHAAGARVAAVASGAFDLEALARTGAEYVYPDLEALAQTPPWR